MKLLDAKTSADLVKLLVFIVITTMATGLLVGMVGNLTHAGFVAQQTPPRLTAGGIDGKNGDLVVFGKPGLHDLLNEGALPRPRWPRHSQPQGPFCRSQGLE